MADEGKSRNKPAAPSSAIALLKEFQGQLTLTATDDDVPARNAKVLADYYNAEEAGLAAFIFNYAHDRVLAITLGDEAFEINQLCLVLPFLNVPDNAWSKRDVDDFPLWCRSSAGLTMLEKASIHLERPLAGYWFSAEANLGVSPSGDELARRQMAYLNRIAKSVYEEKVPAEQDLSAAIACFAAGAKIAHFQGLVQNEHDFRLALAQGLVEHKDFSLADEQAQLVISGSPEDHAYGTAQMLHLRSLYGMQQYVVVISGVDQCKDDKRCQSCLPQILFMGCMAGRQSGMSEIEQQKRERQFLGKYPDHPLAGYIYLAQSLDFVAEAKYDEANNLFKLIESKYPQADFIPRVRAIEKKLTASAVSSSDKPQ